MRNLLVEEQAVSGDQSTLTLHLASAEKVRYERRDTAGSGQVRRIVLGDDNVAKAETVVYEGAKKLSFRYFNDGKWLNKPEDGVPRAVACELQGDQREQRLVVSLEVEHVGE